MKKKFVKSQVTMLMIIGIALFILVSLVLYLSKSAIKKQSERNVKGIQDTAIEPQPIKEYITKCLDKTAKDAVLLLGRQGGYLYQSQGGTLLDFRDPDDVGKYFIKYSNLNVAYNILPPKFNILSATPPSFSSIPDYPWKTFPYKTETSSEQIFYGYFGTSNMPPLESRQGPNSIQSQIESYVDHNVASCIDIDIFKQQGFDIDINSTKTSAFIGDDYIKIKSSIPITINNPTSKELSVVTDFSTDVDVRLKDTYYFARKLIDKDITNIQFDMKDTKNSEYPLNVKVIENVFSSDDIIVVSNVNSLIFGRSFEYIFARKNRAPALYYIKTNIVIFPRDYLITEQELKQKTIGNSEFEAIDPDEDDYIISIKPLHPVRTAFPFKLDIPETKFRVEVSDGELKDYQDITVYRTE